MNDLVRQIQKVAVVVGRFQVHELHEGHRHLLMWAQKRADKLVVVLGVTQAQPSARNGLTRAMRAVLIHEEFPEADVLSIENHPSDAEWSRILDELLMSTYKNCEIALYGSRDSFLEAYCGSLEVRRVPQISTCSGTDVRASLESLPYTREYRAGVLAGLGRQYPSALSAVDVACIRHEDAHVLLSRKKTDPANKFRFPGGFVDPEVDESKEGAAARELREETGIALTHEYTYVCSSRSNDYRYRGEVNKIFTTLYKTHYMGGTARACDDVHEVKWVPLASLPGILVDDHKTLGERLLASL